MRAERSLQIKLFFAAVFLIFIHHQLAHAHEGHSHEANRGRVVGDGVQFVKEDHSDYYDHDISSRVEVIDQPIGKFKALNESELQSDIKFHQRSVVIFHNNDADKIPDFFASIMKELRNVNNDLMFGEYNDYSDSTILKERGLELSGMKMVLFFQEGNAEVFDGNLNDKFQVFPWLRERIISYFSIIRTEFEMEEFLSDKNKIKILGVFNEQLVLINII